jgi:hypothetical protein
MPKGKRTIKIFISHEDNTIIDSFLVEDYRTDRGEDCDLDIENTGSPASESILIDRIRRYVEGR